MMKLRFNTYTFFRSAFGEDTPAPTYIQCGYSEATSEAQQKSPTALDPLQLPRRDPRGESCFASLLPRHDNSPPDDVRIYLIIQNLYRSIVDRCLSITITPKKCQTFFEAVTTCRLNESPIAPRAELNHTVTIL